MIEGEVQTQLRRRSVYHTFEPCQVRAHAAVNARRQSPLIAMFHASKLMFSSGMAGPLACFMRVEMDQGHCTRRFQTPSASNLDCLVCWVMQSKNLFLSELMGTAAMSYCWKMSCATLQAPTKGECSLGQQPQATNQCYSQLARCALLQHVMHQLH